MLFSFGYNHDDAAIFADLVELLGARILDVRATPWGKQGWRKPDLSRQFGARYEWCEVLGGRAFRARSEEWLPAPLSVLMPFADRAREENLILLCACAEPWSCHRHHELAVPLLSRGVETLHIHGDQVIEASDLQIALRDGTPCPYRDLCDWLDTATQKEPMPSTNPNDTLWQARALAQKIPGGDEIDKLLVPLQVEREKVRAILDGLHAENTHDMTLIDLAESASNLFARLEEQRDDLIDKLEMQADGSVAADGYHAFATSSDWRYPDGEPMPIWEHLPHEVQDAFVAFAKAITKGT